jgi:hypothetical protein
VVELPNGSGTKHQSRRCALGVILEGTDTPVERLSEWDLSILQNDNWGRYKLLNRFHGEHSSVG